MVSVVSPVFNGPECHNQGGMFLEMISKVCWLCRLSDLVGADIGKHVGENFAKDFGERIYPTALIHLLNEKKRLGEKTGSGFYKFDNRRKASPDPDLAPIIAESRKVLLLATSMISSNNLAFFHKIRIFRIMFNIQRHLIPLQWVHQKEMQGPLTCWQCACSKMDDDKNDSV